MIRRFINILATVFSFVVVANPLNCEALSPLYDNQLIEKVEVIIEAPPGSPISKQEVLSHLKMKEGEFFSQTEFDNDLKALAKTYNRIEPYLEPVDGKMQITLKVWPKPIIRSIQWEGVRKGSKIESGLKSELGIVPGTLYDRRSFNEAFHKLKILYIRSGYFEVELDYCINVDPDTNEADIIIKVNEGRIGRIKSIYFENFSRREQQDILELMLTKTHIPFFSWLTGEGTYSEEMVQQDQYTIIDYLQNLGYADAQVEIEVRDKKRTMRGLELIIKADRKERYYFGPITFEGNEIFSDEELRNVFCIREGKAYSPEALRNTITAVNNLYGKCGHIEAVVDFDPDLNPDTNEYSIHLSINEGSQYRVGLIKVFGNCVTDTSVILHETLLTPGEIFNIRKLKRTEDRLCNVGYFKNINVYAVRSEDESILGECYRDVHIEVEEMNTGNIGFFAGLSSQESGFAGINLTEKNFSAAGLDRIFTEGFNAVRGGGEYAHLSASFGNKSRDYSLSWTKPYFRDTRWSIGVDVNRSYNRFISDDYGIESGGISLYTGVQCNSFLRYSYHYRLQNSQTNTHFSKTLRLAAEGKMIDPEDPDRIIQLPTNEIQLAEQTMNQLRRQRDSSGLVSAFGGAFSYDSTDSIMRPTRGLRSRFEVEISGAGGRHDFAAFAFINTWYQSVSKRSVLKLHVDMRFINPYGRTTFNNMPLDERLFLGGDTFLRGYRPYRVGPLYPFTDDPTGGLSSQIYTAEVSSRLHSRVDLFMFLDAGNLSAQKWHIPQPKLSLGAGLRIKIYPNAPPVMIGYGFPLNPDNSTQVKNFFFSMGGKF